MSGKNLNEILADCGDVVDFLRNQQVGPNVYPGVPAEYSNWRVEQRAWQQTCVLFRKCSVMQASPQQKFTLTSIEIIYGNH